MSIFDKDRVGQKVMCRVSRDDGVSDVGFVKWTHAAVGRVVPKLDTLSRGKLPGPWTVQEIDVPFEIPAVGDNI